MTVDLLPCLLAASFAANLLALLSEITGFGGGVLVQAGVSPRCSVCVLLSRCRPGLSRLFVCDRCARRRAALGPVSIWRQSWTD
ncbi:hypothetical protein ACFPN7_26690 [Amycolatopsis halotolerans]|uniref:hypothetical protein n=1 Tax=Amycolatopsis halotolerans TaxID=330083 RepID=UPI003624052C